MAAISYSFCMSMLHSFWQAAVLLLFYFLFNKVLLPKSQPIQKRNFLFLLISFQFILFIITFSYYLTHSPQDANLSINHPNLLFIQIPDRINFITPYAMSLYLLTLAYKLTCQLFSWKKMEMSLKQNLFKPTSALRTFCYEKAFQFGIKRPVKIWLSNHISTPITHGFLKPIILLPIALINQLSTAQVEALVLHELSHIKANDYLLNWWLIIVENIFFFNPFIRIACDKIRLEREKACDNQVVNFKYPALLYAETLLTVQKYQHQKVLFQVAATGSGKNALFKRIQYFTQKNYNGNHQDKRMRFSNVVFALSPLLIIALLYALPIFTFHIPTNRTYKGIKASHDNNQVSKVLPPKENLRFNTEPVIMNRTIAAASNKTFSKTEIDAKPLTVISESEAISIIPVSLNNVTEKEKVIIVKEEASGTGKTIVKGYKAKFINGEWILTPDWMAATNVLKDSLTLYNDSSISIHQMQ